MVFSDVCSISFHDLAIEGASLCVYGRAAEHIFDQCQLKVMVNGFNGAALVALAPSLLLISPCSRTRYESDLFSRASFGHAEWYAEGQQERSVLRMERKYKASFEIEQ